MVFRCICVRVVFRTGVDEVPRSAAQRLVSRVSRLIGQLDAFHHLAKRWVGARFGRSHFSWMLLVVALFDFSLRCDENLHFFHDSMLAQFQRMQSHARDSSQGTTVNLINLKSVQVEVDLYKFSEDFREHVDSMKIHYDWENCEWNWWLVGSLSWHAQLTSLPVVYIFSNAIRELRCQLL